MDSTSSFGQWLKQRRKSLDITQETLAHQAGCAVITLQKIEAGERRPSREMARGLASHLGVPAIELNAFVQFARGRPGNVPAAHRGEGPSAYWLSTYSLANHLPQPLTPLIDREQDVASVRRFLESGHVRLLTLVGPPGVGKTRLAIEVAQCVSNQFEDGCCFISLASARRAEDVLRVIGEALGIKDTSDLPVLRRLKNFLRDKELLLVLDGFEHVLAASPLVTECVAACPWLTLLVTSRASLRVHGEQLYPVTLLTQPPPETDVPLVELLRYGAVALFVDRARAAEPGFRLTTGNAQAVAAICARLDGLPLAIELVASRVRVLPPLTLLSHLDKGLLLGLNGLRDAGSSQYTLRHAMDWSFGLLAPAEQTLLACLSVFVGGFTLDAAMSVCRDLPVVSFELVTFADGSTLDRGELQLQPRSAACTLAADHLITLLASLLDKSLLCEQPAHAGTIRLSMLEVIHEYAQQRLLACELCRVTQRQHADYFARLAEEMSSRLHTGTQLDCLARLDLENANLRAALAWSMSESGDWTLAQRMVSALGWYWLVRSREAEGSRWVDDVLARVEGATCPELARVQLSGALLAIGCGQVERARHLSEQALAFAREAGDLLLASQCQKILGEYYDAIGEVARAVEWWTQGLTLARQLHEPSLAVEQLLHLAAAAADPADGRVFAEEALLLARRAEDPWAQASSLVQLGDRARASGQPDQAFACYQDAIHFAQAVGDERILAHSFFGLASAQEQAQDLVLAEATAVTCLEHAQRAGTAQLVAQARYLLGHLLHENGDPGAAIDLLRASLMLASEEGDRLTSALDLAALATIASDAGHDECAAQLFGAAEVLAEARGRQLQLPSRAQDARNHITTRIAQGDSVLSCAWADGHSMDMERAAACAGAAVLTARATTRAATIPV